VFTSYMYINQGMWSCVDGTYRHFQKIVVKSRLSYFIGRKAYYYIG